MGVQPFGDGYITRTSGQVEHLYVVGEYTLIIVVSALGFFALAAALLVPVYRFLKREERLADELDDVLKAELERRRARSAATRSRNGTGGAADGDGSDDDGGVLHSE